MSAKAFLAFWIIVFWTTLAQADVGFDFSLGLPSAEIGNPSGDNAVYSGVGVGGRLTNSFSDSKTFEFSLDLTARYLDLQNTANSSVQRESANHIGAGLGVSFQWGKVHFGADYSFIKARHLFVGYNSEYIEYDYTPLTYFIGLRYELGQALNVGFSYTASSATLDAGDLNRTSSTKYSDSGFFIHLMYKTNKNSGSFLRSLVE